MKQKLFCLLLLPALCHGQMDKGRMSLAGGVSLRGDNGQKTSSSPRTTGFNIDLRPAYFISDHGMVGIVTWFGASRQEYGVMHNTSSYIHVGAFYTHYFTLGHDNFALLLTPGFSCGLDKGKSASGGATTSSESTSFALFVEPGLTYFFNEQWGFEFRFAGLRYDNPDGAHNDSFTFGVNSFGPFSVGVRYYFRP